ncbi:MAG: hypothetical protein ABIR35_07020 [Polaromonas sp.]
MLTLVLAIKLVAEIALLALFGQWLLGRVLGASRQGNPFYGVLQLLGRPWVSAARWIAPKVVAERHVPALAFLLLLLVWSAASIVKVKICLQIGVALCK